MKKFFYSLMAATLCLMMASCSNPASKLRSLAEDVSNNASEWTDADQWVSFMEDLATTMCDFLESDFTEDDIEEFGDAASELGDALEELDDEIDDEKVIKAFSKANKKIQKNKELEKRMKAAEKKAKKRLKELDLDEGDLRHIIGNINIF